MKAKKINMSARVKGEGHLDAGGVLSRTGGIGTAVISRRRPAARGGRASVKYPKPPIVG